MKLKKIASLALAGVMAVGMLAGCATNKPETKPTDPVEPGVAGVSADVKTLVEAKLEEKLPAYVSFADSAELNSDLQGAVEYAGVMDILPDYVYADQLRFVAGDIYGRLYTAVGATGIKVNTIGDSDVLQKAENVSGYQIDDAVAFEVYAVSSAIGENALKQLIAEKIAKDYGVQDYKYSIENTNGGNYNHEYTVSVSTYTKSVNSAGVGGVNGGIHGNGDVAVAPDLGVVGGSVNGGIHGGSVSAANPSVTFVAVQVVRTSTHQ